MKDLLDFTLFRKKRQDVADYIDSLERQINELTAERARLVHAAPDRDDVKAAVRRSMDRLASGLDAELARGVAQLAREADRLNQAAYVDAVLAGSVPGLQVKAGDASAPAARLLAALTGAAIVERIERVIDATPWPENACSAQQRDMRLAAIDAELAQLKKTRDEAQAAAESAGLSL
jgi:hypothetical protein